MRMPHTRTPTTQLASHMPAVQGEEMASYMLTHDGKLDRWCPVQTDVEEYFRTTLEEGSATPCSREHAGGCMGAHLVEPAGPARSMRAR